MCPLTTRMRGGILKAASTVSEMHCCFQGGDDLYSVHRHFFERHSEYFRKLLSTYWFIDGNHVFLPEVKKVDLRDCCQFSIPRPQQADITTLKGWTSILTLAQKWDMAQSRARAAEHRRPRVADGEDHHRAHARPGAPGPRVAAARVHGDLRARGAADAAGGGAARHGDGDPDLGGAARGARAGGRAGRRARAAGGREDRGAGEGEVWRV
ncbi:hypothetical protein BJ912DRAFT_316102 [Pholiota molesta]|nr:hypothetical protein BJ912DRAFT_316102 [Pholiota molesta]